jgi:CHAT domain-containing protein
LLWLIPCCLVAQPEADILFNAYYAKSIEKLREVYAVRNATFICQQGDVNTNYKQDVLSFINAFGEKSSEVGVLFYSVGADTLRIWLVSQKQWLFHSAAVTPQQLSGVEYALRNAMGVDTLAATRAAIPKEGDEKTLRSTLKKVASTNTISLSDATAQATRLLFPPPIAKGLQGLTHLFIIPEYNIGQFPFHALQPFGKDSYLVDSCSWSFVPHLCNFDAFAMTYRNQIGRVNSLRSNRALVVGDPTFSAEAGFYLPALPGAAAEAKMVARALETEPLMNGEATLSKVKQLAPEADLLYFATHGHFDDNRMLDGSFLAFAADSASSSGLLSAREIQNLKLSAELAVLSACQTGFGKVYSGGFHGIGRAFYKAGVNFSVISLWSVNDMATKELMLRFVVKLMAGDYFYPARQLQEAIKAVKAKYPDPANWAAFSVFGFTY